ncbi:MAG: lamin tail domain-containing protein [Verrucomicrobia bacterium]|nr:lamin tail domain-containing protein [Verrucomicrobiota bacterium]
MFKRMLIGLCFSTVSWMAGARGAPLLSETFDYPDGVLQTVSSGKWIGHSGGTNQVDVAGGLLKLTGSESQDVHALISGQPYSPTNSAKLYASFDLNVQTLPSGAGAYFAHFKDASAGFRGRIWVLTNGAALGSFRVGVSAGSGSEAASVHTQDLKPSVDHKIVCRLAVSNSVTALWINPSSEADSMVATEAATAVPIAAFAFRQASGIGVLAIDNLRVGTNFNDVVPVLSPETVSTPPPETSPPIAPSSPPQSAPPALPGSLPLILRQPESHIVNAGQDATFMAEAQGPAPLSYQWQFNQADIPGATNAVLSLSAVSAAQQGEYRLMVKNASGVATSIAARLTVLRPDPPRILIQFTNYLANPVRPGDTLTNTFAEHALRPGETLTMRVAVAAPDQQAVTLSADSDGLPASARWVLDQTEGTNRSAVFTFNPTAAEAGSNFVARLLVSASDATITNTWSAYVPTAEEQQIAITEFLPNPATTNTAPHFNPLRRAEPAPNPGWQDEFIELVNNSDRGADLSKWTISDSAQVRHRFPEAYALQSWAAIIVYGGPQTGFPPTLTAPAQWANESSTGLGLNNSGGDMIILRNARGNMISRIVYSSSSVNSSLTRHPTLDDGFVSHADVSANVVSPGVNYDGRLFHDIAQLPIAPIVVAVSWEGEKKLALTWNAERGKTYSVLHAADLAGPFTAIATELRFAEKKGRYAAEGTGATGARFYRISSP